MTDVWQRSEVTKQRIAEVQEELLQRHVNRTVLAMKSAEHLLRFGRKPVDTLIETWCVYAPGEEGKAATEAACNLEYEREKAIGPRGLGPDPASEPTIIFNPGIGL